MPQEKQTSNKPRAEELLDRYQQCLPLRQNFDSYWQTLHDYFYIEAADTTRAYYPGSELDATSLWDSTTLETADVLASGFMNYLTPPSSKWFRLRARSKDLENNKAVAYYLEDVAEEVNYTLNRSNFYDQIFPSYKSSGVYGTSVLLEEEDISDEARFFNMPLKQVVIIEDSRGRISEYFIEFEYTARQAEDRWGREILSDKMQEELKAGKGDSKHKFLLFIAKRSMRDVTKTDKKNLPIEAAWVDVEAKKVLDEGGYYEFPAMCHRFDKRPFISWGFSPAMKSLPFARLLNAIAKTNLRSMMKHTDPPIALPENAFIMPFNVNPRALNYYKKSAMDNAKDIFAFGNFGDPQVGMNAVEYYSLKVKSLMFYDVFLAFSGIDKQMNNPEIMERINEKMTLLGPAVGRYTSEVLNPIIVRTIGILARRGKLPQPPDELIDDPNYEIDFVGQLAMAQRRSELNSLTTGLSMVGQMAQFIPDVMDKISTDKVVDETWNILGAPVKVLREDSEIDALRQARAEQAAQVNMIQKMGAGAQIAGDMATAEKTLKESKEVKE